MSEKILIAVDSSENMQKTVTYVARFVAGIKDVQIALFHVLPGLPLSSIVYIMDDKNAIEEWEQKNKKRVKEALLSVEKILIQSGIPRENIITKIKPMVKGAARDILSEANEGNYGTIVLNRRGISATREFLLGSVSNKVIHHAKNCAVWVVE